VGRLPASTQALLARWFGKRVQPRATIRTPTPTLVVWLEQKAGSTSSPQGQVKALLADSSNFTSDTSMNCGGLGENLLSFEPGLWPSEAAWKLKCELKRFQGFVPGETFTFQGVPLEALSSTNQLKWTTNFGGATVTLSQVARRQDLLDFTFNVTGLTNGMYLDLLWARTDSSSDLESVSLDGSATDRRYHFRNLPAEARSADVTFAVHRGRWVEFMVKPEFGPGLLENQLPNRR